jgi:hypothetical protein
MSPDPSNTRRAQLELFTFKRGLLAAVGHDLCLGVDDLELELGAGTLRAWCGLDSLRVLGAMQRGALARSEPSEHDRRAILDTVRREILHTERHPRAELIGTLQASSGSAELRAKLTLHGVTRPLVIALPLAASGATLTVRTALQPSLWGIAPYSALGGALKLQDRVQVVLTLDVDPALLADPTSASARWTAKPQA